jgi:hypothetical protein
MGAPGDEAHHAGRSIQADEIAGDTENRRMPNHTLKDTGVSVSRLGARLGERHRFGTDAEQKRCTSTICEPFATLSRFGVVA